MLNSVKDLKQVNAIKVVRLEKNGTTKFPNEYTKATGAYINIDDEQEVISFKVMSKPVSEGGYGCQFTDLIEVGLHQLKYFNNKYPCRENAITITKLEEALLWQAARTADRVNRGVEGTNVS